MLIMLTNKVRPKLGGWLSRYLVCAAHGVYIGKANARLRDLLWKKALQLRGGGSVLQAWQDSTSIQGFKCRESGEGAFRLQDLDGLFLTVAEVPEEE